MAQGYLTIMINREDVGELYRMLQWWCQNQSNTFHYIKRAIEERYPDLKRKYDNETLQPKGCKK